MRNALLGLSLLSLTLTSVALAAPEEAYYVRVGLGDTLFVDDTTAVIDLSAAELTIPEVPAGGSVWVSGLTLDLDPAEAVLGELLTVSGDTHWLVSDSLRGWDTPTCQPRGSVDLDLGLTPSAVVLYTVVDATGAEEVVADVLYDVEVLDPCGAPYAGDAEITLGLGTFSTGSSITIPGVILSGIEPAEID